MTYQQLIVYGQNKLKAHQLEPNVAFKILFKIDKKIKDLTTYTNICNKNMNLIQLWKFKYILFQYINFQKPLPYLLHTINFYYHDFIVDKKVHIPKSETEIMVNEAIKLIDNTNGLNVLDLCCGTGVIGISLLLQQNINLTLIDNDQKAIDNTKKNLKKYNLKAKVIKQDLFNGIQEKYDLILCNPPYVSFEDQEVEYSVIKYESKSAIFAKCNGLYFYQKIMHEINNHINPKAVLIFEISNKQKTAVLEIIKANQSVAKTNVILDQFNQERFVIVYFK